MKKEGRPPESLVGTWELRHILGVQIAGAPSHLKKGTDNDSWKVFMKISGNQLLISSGSIASDGITSTYEKL